MTYRLVVKISKGSKVKYELYKTSGLITMWSVLLCWFPVSNCFISMMEEALLMLLLSDLAVGAITTDLKLNMYSDPMDVVVLMSLYFQVRSSCSSNWIYAYD
ncbi:hypothetical protein Nepgr_008143 [Nepenthes gracilis]|uniref:Uncharacterized protein n=1 Tax=Nepenthes gracilis TaxID=150966 RepID=A0AAD3S853_NEPGR|nr:hypothetical protein Nepgr_008143 [Nepenthes gracilis]